MKKKFQIFTVPNSFGGMFDSQIESVQIKTGEYYGKDDKYEKTRQLEPFDTYERAEKWILDLNNTNKDLKFTILPVYVTKR